MRRCPGHRQEPVDGLLRAWYSTAMKKTLITACTAALCALVAGCYSVPETIPAQTTSQQLIQFGQSSFENGNTAAAEVYYLTLIERYGSDPALRVEAMFEIAHMDIKEKKWERAVPILREIQAMYETELAQVLPGAYRQLAEIDLAKVPEDALAAIPLDAPVVLGPGAPAFIEPPAAEQTDAAQSALPAAQAPADSAAPESAVQAGAAGENSAALPPAEPQTHTETPQPLPEESPPEPTPAP